MMRRVPLLLTALLLGGCSWFNLGDDALEPSELTDFEAALSVDRLWSRDVGESSEDLGLALIPHVEDGVVYAAGSEGHIVAVDAASGDQLWSVDTELQSSGGPAVSGSLLVIGGLDGTVLALDANTGEQRWRVKVSSEVLAVPAIAGSRVVVRSIDGRVHALMRDDGSRIWTYDSDVPLLTLRGISSPVVRAGQVMIGTDGGDVVALSLDDGSVVWETSAATPEGRSELERLVDIDGHMALVVSNLYVAGYHGNLAALAVESGRKLWAREISTSSGVTAMGNRLFVSDANDTVWAFDRNGGNSLWKNDELLRHQLTAPAPWGDYVVVGGVEGILHVLSADSGDLLARVQMDDSPIDVMPQVENGVVYALSRSGELAAYRFTPR